MNALKRFWAWLLGKTTVDETIQERVALVKKELKDVKEAIKEVAGEAKMLSKLLKVKRRPLQKSLWLRRMHLQNPQQRKGEDLRRRSKHSM